MYRLFCLALFACLGAGLMLGEGRAGCDNYCRIRGNFWDCKSKACFSTAYATCQFCMPGNWCDDTLGGGFWWCRAMAGPNAWYWAVGCSGLCPCDPGIMNVESDQPTYVDLTMPNPIQRTYCGL